MNQILYSKKSERRTKIVALIFCILLILAIVVSISFGFANKTNTRILKGVYINDVSLANMTVEDATSKLNEKLAQMDNNVIELTYGEYKKTITAKDLGLFYSDQFVNDAYNYGRNKDLIRNNYTVLGSLLNKEYHISAQFEINEDKFQELLTALHENVEIDVKNDTYEVANGKITLEKGYEGKKIKAEELKTLLLASAVNSKIEVELPVEIEKPERVDFDKLYDEVYVEKVEASYKEGENFEVTKEVYGVYFNKEEAIKRYNELLDGKTMEIKLITVEPTVKVSDLNNELFRDVLATFSTKYDKYYTNRVKNLELAGRKVNGTILYPGEEFSYNKVVGKRTVANGFKEAHVFAGGKVVDGLGGGICQVSTTLYNTVLMSDLKVTERKAHMMHTGYNEPGKDATVVYGSIDFRFVNNRKTPIKISMEVKNGVVTSTIYGLKMENEPIIEIKSVILKTIPYTTIEEKDAAMNEGTTKVVQSPVNGYVSETYRIEKDASGKEISRKLISKDTYKQTSKIIKVGTKKVEKPVEPVKPVTPTEPTTPDENTPSLPTGWDNPESPYVQ